LHGKQANAKETAAASSLTLIFSRLSFEVENWKDMINSRAPSLANLGSLAKIGPCQDYRGTDKFNREFFLWQTKNEIVPHVTRRITAQKR
jgi:hypothetical protein